MPTVHDPAAGTDDRAAADPPAGPARNARGLPLASVPRASWTLAAFCLVLPGVLWGLSRIRLENDVENWLPKDDPYAVRLAWFERHFPSDERLVVGWDGVDAADPRLLAFADALRGAPDAEGVMRGGTRLVEGVVTPSELAARMVESGVDGDDAVDHVVGLLAGGGPLRVVLSGAGRADPDTAAATIAGAVRVAAGVDASVAAAPEPELLEDDAAYAAADAGGDEDAISTFAPVRPHDLTVEWPRIDADPAALAAARAATLAARDAEGRTYVDEAFRQPGSPAAVSLTLSGAGAADRKATVRAILDAAATVGVEPDELRIGGRTVTALALNEAIKRTAFNRSVPWWNVWAKSPVGLSFLVSAALAFWLLGGLGVGLAVLGSTVAAVFASLSLVPITGGGMNMVLVVMPSLLMVLTLSAGVHLVNYFRRAAAIDPATAVARALATARVPTTLAACTTAVGLASLAVSPLVPVREFGVYSAVGCGVMLLVTLVGLPAILAHLPARPKPEGAGHAAWERFAAGLVANRHKVVIGCLTVAAVCSVGLKWFRTETKVIKYFPETAKVVRDYDYFERNVTGVIPVEVVVRFDRDLVDGPESAFTERLELVREITERVRSHPEISGALSLASFRPPAEPLPADAGFFAKNRYFRAAAETERRVKEEPASAGFLTVAEAAAPTDDGGTLAEPGDELWRIGAQANILTDVDYAVLTADLERIAAETLAETPGSAHAVTGLVPLFLRTQTAVLDGLISSFGLAFAVIAIVMSVVLGSARAGCLSMLPNILPVTSVFGLVSWFAVPVDIGTMISASVALGIAVDGTLHLVAAFRHAPPELNRRQAAADALVACGPALWQTSLIVGLGLLVLAPAELLLVSRFGWLMAALIAAALVADVVLLPALLAGPMGGMIRRAGVVPNEETVAEEVAVADEPVRPQLAAYTRPAAG